MGQQWYVMVDENNQRGPLTEEGVKELIESGHVSGANYCWTEGFEGWAPLGQVPTFAQALQDAPTRVQPSTRSTAASERWDTIKSSLDRGKRGAARKVKIAKLKVRTSQLRKNRERLCSALGTEVYLCRQDLQLGEDFKDHIESIGRCDDDIAGVEREIAEIEAEAK